MSFNFFKKKAVALEINRVTLPKYDIRYSYEWKNDVPLNERDTEISPSRPFCKKMLSMNKLYSRTDIQNISQLLGYDVMHRVGGNGCRHEWVSQIVINKTDLK